ncbi:SDR family oxidoreductase [Nocardia farcinica]|uniref:SDR family oxidoreductase n=1 Tax=Nocardia farcinica TaxID=37329 RepID=UPI001894E421|nr:SDR family oxidoreductase [Nocardia farcinica]MBF6522980.1 SDR family oxidoreductase [Nocardia farcinica]
MEPGTVVVTGGSRGIGAATARRLARDGFAVHLTYRERADAADRLVREIAGSGGHARATRVDLSVPGDVDALFAAVDADSAPLVGLVNNAGLLETQCRVADLDAARLHRVMAANVVGPMLCAAAAVRRMSTRHGGRGGAIVNVSSVAARLGAPGEYVDYAASKGALDTFTRGLAAEVAGEGIRVNAVRPGYIHTDIHALGGDPDRVERLGPALPMGRGGRPEEVAEAIAWLLSAAASYTTGSFLDLAGGR